MKTAVKATRKLKAELPAEYWLAWNVHRMRISRKMTQVKLAESAGISLRSLVDIENLDLERSSPSLNRIARIAKALGVEVLDLFMKNEESENFMGQLLAD